MSSDLFEIILPSLVFFFAFFVVNILLEMGVVFLLNTFFCKHWMIVTKFACSRRRKWHRRAEFALCLSVSLSLLAIIAATHTIDIFVASDLEIKIYVLELFLATLLIYRITSRLILSDIIGNCKELLLKAFGYLFFFTSVLLAILTILFLNQQYESFKRLIHSTLIYPITGKHALILKNGTKGGLITAFREQIYQGLCPRMDYSTCTSDAPVVNLIYVTTQLDLRLDTHPIIHSDPKDYLSGRACTKGSTTFLLTDHGQWYWVIDESKIVKE
ncbi:hypothetical protein HZA44_00950 [Candidatus Peregrinibacteria bacterium]|nr:hypothetical protein [Candidatus Peregrinibacteria bacterium]